MSDLTDTTDSWDNYSINHSTRGMTWLVATAVFFILGVLAAAAENVFLQLAQDPVSGPMEIVFGVCMVTAILHGVALLAVHRQERRTHDSKPGRYARILLAPGNRYFVGAVLLVLSIFVLSR